MLKWWGERTYHLGFHNTRDGFFVDQLWFNLVPLYYQNVVISQQRGFNMGPWNLHERKLNFKENKYYVNDNYKLIFYHFSNYKPSQPDTIANYYNRYSFEKNNDLSAIYKDYHDSLIENNYEKHSTIKCVYIKLREEIIEENKRLEEIRIKTPKWYVKKTIKLFLPPISIKAYKKFIK